MNNLVKVFAVEEGGCGARVALRFDDMSDKMLGCTAETRAVVLLGPGRLADPSVGECVWHRLSPPLLPQRAACPISTG